MLNASKLKAIIEADASKGVAALRAFSDEFRKTRDVADREAKGAGDAIHGGFKNGIAGAKAEVGGLKSVLLGTFGSNVIWDMIKGGFAGVLGVISGTARAIGNVGAEALSSISNYEMLTMSIEQLTATQILEAGAAKDMAEALALSKKPAQDTLQWLEKLAIESPQRMNEVADAYRRAMTFGFSSGEAKRLTVDLLDLSAASGRQESGFMERISDAFGKMYTKGRVSMEELNRLMEAGIPALKVLAREFDTTEGKMSEMVSDGALPAGRAIRALEVDIETRLGGAAKRTTQTWSGMISSLGDLKDRGLRNLFTGVFDSVKEDANNIVSILSSQEFANKAQSVGLWLGEGFKAGAKTAREIILALGGEDGPLAGLAQFFKFDNLDTEGVKNAFSDLVMGVAVDVVEGIGWVEKAAIAAKEIIKGIGDAWKEVRSIILGIEKFLNDAQKLSTNAGIGLRNSLNGVASINWVDQLAPAVEALRGGNLPYPYQGAGGASGGGSGGGGSMFGDEESLEDKMAAVNRKTDEWIKKIKDGHLAAKGLLDDTAESAKTITVNTKSLDDALNGKLAPGAAKAGENAGKKAGEQFLNALEKAIGKAQGILEKGMGASINLGRINPEPGMPGANDWAEDIFRIQDVAMNLGTGHEGKDTRKWYQQYFDGMGFEEATARAKSIVGKFQAGLFMDPEVSPYLDKTKARASLNKMAEGEKQTAQFAREVGADEETLINLMGIKKTTGSDKATDEQVAAAMAILKGQMVDSAGKLGAESPTVFDAFINGAAQPAGSNGASSSAISFSSSFLTAVDADIVANKDKFQQTGGKAWDEVETGFIDRAKKSTAFVAAIDAMVDNSIARYVPTNK